MSQRARFCQRREALQKLQHRARRLPDDIVSKPRSVVQRDDELQIKVLAQLFIAQVRTPPRPSGYCARSSPVEDSPSPDPESRVPDISCDSDRDGSTPGKYDVLQAEESDSDSETDSGSECDSGSESDSGEEDDNCRSRLDTICEEEKKEEAICGEEEDTICEEEEEEDAICGEKDADCEKEEDAICGEEEDADCEEEEDAICGEKDAICEEEDANCGEEKDANCGEEKDANCGEKDAICGEEKDANCGEEKDANCGEEEDAICGEEDANCGEEDASFDDVDLESLSSNQSEDIRGKKRGSSRKTKWWRKLCCWLRQEDTDDELE